MFILQMQGLQGPATSSTPVSQAPDFHAESDSLIQSMRAQAKANTAKSKTKPPSLTSGVDQYLDSDQGYQKHEMIKWGTAGAGVAGQYVSFREKGQVIARTAKALELSLIHI